MNDRKRAAWQKLIATALVKSGASIRRPTARKKRPKSDSDREDLLRRFGK